MMQTRCRHGQRRELHACWREVHGRGPHARRVGPADRQDDDAGAIGPRRVDSGDPSDVEARRGQRRAVPAQRAAQRPVRTRDVLDREQSPEPRRHPLDELDPRIGGDASHAAQPGPVVREHVQSALVPRLHADEERFRFPADPGEILAVLRTDHPDGIEHPAVPGRDVDDGERDGRVRGPGVGVGHRRRCDIRSGQVDDLSPTDPRLVDAGEREPAGAWRPPHPADARHLLRRDELRASPCDPRLLDEATELGVGRTEVHDGHAVIVMECDLSPVR